MPRAKKLNTFEEADAYVSQNYGKGSSKALDVCGAWARAKPIISYLFGLPLIPKRWSDVFKGLSVVLDNYCAAPPA